MPDDFQTIRWRTPGTSVATHPPVQRQGSGAIRLIQTVGGSSVMCQLVPVSDRTFHVRLNLNAHQEAGTMSERLVHDHGVRARVARPKGTWSPTGIPGSPTEDSLITHKGFHGHHPHGFQGHPRGFPGSPTGDSTITHKGFHDHPQMIRWCVSIFCSFRL